MVQFSLSFIFLCMEVQWGQYKTWSRQSGPPTGPLLDPIWTPSGPLLDPLLDCLLDCLLDPLLDPLFFLPENTGS